MSHTPLTRPDIAPIADTSMQQREPRRFVMLRRYTANRGAVVGAVILSVLIAWSVLGPFFVNDPIKQDVLHRLARPSATYWFGTDELGRDVYARVVNGGRISLASGLVSVLVGLVGGTIIGVVAGFLAGRIALVLMALIDLLLALPAILLAITIAARLGTGLVSAMLAAGIVGLPAYARLARASTLAATKQEYVEAARALGASDLQIMTRHILPNILTPLIVQSTIGVGNAILLVAALGFLGLGAQPPTPEWGRMLSDAQGYITDAPYLGIFSGLAIALTVLSFNLIGDGLRDALV